MSRNLEPSSFQPPADARGTERRGPVGSTGGSSVDPSHDTPSRHGMNTPGSNDAAAARDPRAPVPFVPRENAAPRPRPAESNRHSTARNGPYVLARLALLLCL